MTTKPYLPEASFLDLYKQHCGKTEVPPQFHLWSAISLLAASVQDRVWVVKHAGSKLPPNLYIMLLGPSGLGKGQAIGTAAKLIEPFHEQFNVYWGRITGQALADTIGVRVTAGTEHPLRRNDVSAGDEVMLPKHTLVDAGRLWLIAEELTLSVGSGPRAHDFVTFMTGLYNGSPVPFSDSSRTAGTVRIYSPCINWLAGSTRDWMLRSVSRDAIEGGFFARTLTIEAAYDLEHRIAEPWYPNDREQLVAELRYRLGLLLNLRDYPVRLSPSAREVMREWYTERAAPRDPALIPSWRRAHDMSLKLGTLLALSRWTGAFRRWEAGGERGDPPGFVIEASEVAEAQRLVSRAHGSIPDLVRVAANTTLQGAGVESVRQILEASPAAARQGQGMQRSDLMRKAGGRGLNAKQVDEALSTLVAQHRVEESKGDGKRGARWYRWLKRERQIREVGEVSVDGGAATST